MQAIQLKDIPKGEFFKRKIDSKKVYIRADYQRDSKKFQCDDCLDVWGNGLLIKGSALVYVGFEY